MGYITVTVSEDVYIDTDEFIDEISDEELLKELVRRKKIINPDAVDQNHSAVNIIEWFESPFVSEYDKMQVLNKINFDYILSIDEIKNNL